jgi:hypothetical protein
MNYRMSRNMAVSKIGSRENNVMTKAAEDFLAKEVKDPELKKKLEPHSKCALVLASSAG